jgi:hypothetical protein
MAFLDEFKKLGIVNITSSFVICVTPSACLAVCPKGIIRLPVDGFSWNLIFENFPKICF